MKTATYDSNYVVTIKDVPSIGLEAFWAEPANYAERIKQLVTRKGADSNYLVSLAGLIGELFKRRVIEKCTITYGTKLEFKLSRRGEGAQILGLDGARERFEEAFEDITSQKIAITWNDTGETLTERPSRGKRDFSGVGDAIARLLDTVSDAVVFAVVFDWLKD